MLLDFSYVVRVARFSASPHLVMFGAAPPNPQLSTRIPTSQLLPSYLLGIVLTGFCVYSRPGRLPDCQLVLGGMLCPSFPQGYTHDKAWSFKMLPIVALGMFDDTNLL